jgi:hypothetical protein
MHFNISEELSSLLISNNPFNRVPNLSILVEARLVPRSYSKAKLMASLAFFTTSVKNSPS